MDEHARTETQLLFAQSGKGVVNRRAVILALVTDHLDTLGRMERWRSVLLPLKKERSATEVQVTDHLDTLGRMERWRSVLLPLKKERSATEVQSRAEQSRAEQSRAEQSRAEQSRAEQSRAEQSRAEQSRAEEKRGEQRRAEERRGEQPVPIAVLPVWRLSIGSYFIDSEYFRISVVLTQADYSSQLAWNGSSHQPAAALFFTAESQSVLVLYEYVP
ncbi:hypothetical protein VOLCADRAFT_94078 [Volvox carteri f. nagariensis]|uniref:Uncharacterized protein n=1 Tax=Volvox carteri f. nagariensis TaxID=3068 RepID=D8U3V1_VOLCA|nr:uncharacterized protein VOLCADRAFT_94078 [Volvox carteri f. nagariensis]EFJ45673.1 hypothetical protein VOLCADRAFT_94078 [Volvox carteri f. nagariensis]|eukprot:XP_002953363.1 hypothetical protein VOLCADRAFT_94078 [Volvox carteri f. nagariensis]